MYFNSPVKYTIAGKYMNLNFLQWHILKNGRKQNPVYITKYSINVTCGKQQIYRFGPGLNFNVNTCINKNTRI